MICRLAVFEGQPERFTSGHAYRYVFEAIKSVEGFRGGYHLAGEAEALSVTYWVDDAAMRAGDAAVGAATQRLGLKGSPPTRVTTYRVATAIFPTSDTASE